MHTCIEPLKLSIAVSDYTAVYYYIRTSVQLYRGHPPFQYGQLRYSNRAVNKSNHQAVTVFMRQFCILPIRQHLLDAVFLNVYTDSMCSLSYSDIAYWSGLVDLHTDNVFLTEAPGIVLLLQTI